jgi:hypothetical protein
MGAYEFTTISRGQSADEAFRQARDAAAWEHGHGGYTGSIAEKNDFRVITGPLSYTEASVLAWRLIEADDPRISDRWGPAGCIPIKDSDAFLFFGWASS